VKIAVVGGGAWGTALAQIAAKGGRETLLWAREAEVVEAVNSTHENRLFLPGIDNYAHAGGFAGGYLVAAYLNPHHPERVQHVVIALLCLAASMLAVVASVLDGLQYF